MYPNASRGTVIRGQSARVIRRSVGHAFHVRHTSTPCFTCFVEHAEQEPSGLDLLLIFIPSDWRLFHRIRLRFHCFLLTTIVSSQHCWGKIHLRSHSARKRTSPLLLQRYNRNHHSYSVLRSHISPQSLIPYVCITRLRHDFHQAAYQVTSLHELNLSLSTIRKGSGCTHSTNTDARKPIDLAPCESKYPSTYLHLVPSTSLLTEHYRLPNKYTMSAAQPATMIRFPTFQETPDGENRVTAKDSLRAILTKFPPEQCQTGSTKRGTSPSSTSTVSSTRSSTSAASSREPVTKRRPS